MVRLTDHLPYDLCDETVEPVYKDFKGWQQSLDGIHDFDAIPQELVAYVKFLEEELKLPITFISTGPDREALISREAATLCSI
jgi:adenylosuccinate synthase